GGTFPDPGRTAGLQSGRLCCEGPAQPSRYPARKTHRQRALANRVRVKSFPYPSPFRERSHMRFPQVSERVKEAPANALRSVFASIGQVLLVTDRMKKKSGEGDETAPESAAPAGEAGAANGVAGSAEGTGALEGAAAETAVVSGKTAPGKAPTAAGKAAAGKATAGSAGKTSAGKAAAAKAPAGCGGAG